MSNKIIDTPITLGHILTHKGRIIYPTTKKWRLEILLFKLLIHNENRYSVHTVHRIEKVQAALLGLAKIQ